jgi:hypothetical protein
MRTLSICAVAATLIGCDSGRASPELDPACVAAVEAACTRACDCAPNDPCTFVFAVPGGGGDTTYGYRGTCIESRRWSYCMGDAAGVDFPRCREDVLAAQCVTSRSGLQGVQLPASCPQ